MFEVLSEVVNHFSENKDFHSFLEIIILVGTIFSRLDIDPKKTSKKKGCKSSGISNNTWIQGSSKFDFCLASPPFLYKPRKIFPESNHNFSHRKFHKDFGFLICTASQQTKHNSTTILIKMLLAIENKNIQKQIEF